MTAADVQIARLVTRQHGVFSAGHAYLLGFSATQVHRRRESGLWIPVYLGSYRLVGVDETWKGRLLAACWAGGYRAVASHRSAAALHGLAGGRRHVAEIICPRWQRARHPGVTVHESKALEPLDVTAVDSIPVTTPERTLLDLGAVCHESVVEMALNRAEKQGLVTLSSLRATLRRLGRRGRNGAGTLRRLVEPHAPDRAMPESEMETMLLQVLRRHGLPDPTPQYEIRHGGRFVARVDAAYPQWRIAIEYDSYEWHGGRLAQDRDSGRRMRLSAASWWPISVTAAALRGGGHELCAAIEGARRSGVADLSSRQPSDAKTG